MKVTITMNYHKSNNVDKKEKVIHVGGKKGYIDMKGDATDKKVTIVASGIVGKEKVDFKFDKEVGKKSAESKRKSGPKKQYKHFERHCKKMAKAWEKQIGKKK